MGNACLTMRSSALVSRRRLLQVGTIGLMGPALSTFGRTGSMRARAKHVLFLHQWGGPSHLDTFDMKPDAPDGIRGQFSPIQTRQPGLLCSEHLPRFARVLDRFAQVRSLHHKMKNHNSAGYYSLTGHAPPIDDQRLRDSRELYPACGSVAAKFRPVMDPSLPSFVSFPHVIRDGSVTPGQHASFLGKGHDPFFVGQDPNSSSFRLPELSLPAETPLARLDDRRGLLKMIDEQGELLEWSAIAQGLDAFHEQAISMLASPKVKQAFDLTREPDAVRDAYGRTTYGQSCLLARRLLEAGTRFVTVYFSNSIGNGASMSGGWDTHGNNFNDLKKRLLPMTDQTVPTLIEDMEARGLLDETLVVWMGEFGRSPRITNTDKFGADGRDHWPQCYTALLGGAGITPGAVFGSSDKIGAYPATNPTRPDDIAATIFWALGIDPATEVIDTLGRPLPIASGRPIIEVFS